MLFVNLKTFKNVNTSPFIKTLLIVSSVILSACNAESTPTSNTGMVEVASVDVAPLQASSSDNGFEVSDPDADDTRSNGAVADVPSVSDLYASNVRAGLVTLQWTSADGDVYQSHTNADAVSYYRVYRNGEFFVDTLSPYVEDASASVGQVEYSVESHKFIAAPEFVIIRSAQVTLTLNVPSFSDDANRYSGVPIQASEFDNALVDFKSCSTSSDSTTISQLCRNHYGYAWQQFHDGRSGELLRNTTSVNEEFLVSVRNTEAELGIAPGIPVWTLKKLSSDVSSEMELTLGTDHLTEGEGHVVNGVAIADNGTVFISGTVYQSYLPRNLGIEVGVIPVTSAYYVAQIDLSSSQIIQFKRFSLEQAPGIAATVNNGVLEMHKVGQVSMFDSTTLTALSSTQVSGYPVFADEQTVYTRSYNPTAYYQFEKALN